MYFLGRIPNSFIRFSNAQIPKNLWDSFEITLDNLHKYKHDENFTKWRIENQSTKIPLRSTRILFRKELKGTCKKIEGIKIINTLMLTIFCKQCRQVKDMPFTKVSKLFFFFKYLFLLVTKYERTKRGRSRQRKRTWK